MRNLFSKNTPRWLIFIFDITVSLTALVLSYLLRFNFSIPEEEYPFIPIAFGAVLAVRVLFFLSLKTYSGIIRYTSTQDAQRVFFGVLYGSLTLVIANLVRYFFIDNLFVVPFSVLIIELLATTFFLIAFRIGIKVLYFELKNPSKEKSTVIIFGAGETGVITKRSIDRDVGSKLKVFAFVESNESLVGKKVEGILISGIGKLEELIEKGVPSHLIIASDELNPEKKQEIIETCLKHNITVFSVPPVRKWINGELSFNQMRKVNVEDLLQRPSINLDTDKIAKLISKKVVLVTGAAGSIGSEIVRQLSNFKPLKVILVDTAESGLYELDNELKNALQKINYEVVIGDIRNEARMNNVFEAYKPRIVFHAAAYKHVPLMEDNPSESILTNVLGTKILADLSVTHNVEEFVYVSTDKAVNPTNVMGASKRAAEMYVQALSNKSGTSFITTRFGNVLGSNGSVIPLFKKQIEKGGPVYVTHPEITRYFMTIPEACQLVLQAGALGNGGEVFVFDMGKSVKIVDLAKKMIKLSGLKLGRDIQISFTGLRPGEKIKEELLTKKETTLPTPHDKIKIAKVEEIEFEQIEQQINYLTDLFNTQDNVLIVSKLKEVVKEYVSNNSEFEKLDV